MGKVKIRTKRNYSKFRRVRKLKKYRNYSELTSKMLRISSVWRIRQMDFHSYKMSKKESKQSI